MRRTTALLVAAIAAMAVTAILAFRATDRIELPLRDEALRTLPHQPATSSIVVAIDEKSLREFGRWPWARTRIAELINRSADAGARAVVVDVLLSEAAPGDDAIRAATHRIHTLAIAALDDRGRWLLPVAGDAVHGNFELDRDGILRRFASTKQSGDRPLTALSVDAASIVTGAPVPVGRSIAPMFRTRPRDVPVISAADFARDPSAAHGRVVFVGPTAAALGDRVLTPVSRELDPGVTIHAAATESLIRGETLRELPPLAAGLLAGIGVALVLLLPSPRIAAALLLIAIVAGGYALIAALHVAIPFITLAIPIVIALGGVEAARVRSTANELQALATRVAARHAREVESKRVLAHELRTPLASMRGLSQLLAAFELNDAERKRVASLLEAEAGKLQLMINGLLDLERLPLRDFRSSTSVIDLGELVTKRIEFLRASSDRSLTTSAAPDVRVRADATLLERVVDNLVGNAMKFSRDAVAISVRRDRGSAVIEVEDRGPGIALQEREKIFDRFFRGSTAAGTTGLGLGLALVAEVAQWHGGSVGVANADGGGARFSVALPLAVSEVKAGAM